MSPSIAFLCGFLLASTLFTAFIVSYYLRARKRVRSIQAAIRNYQQAQSVVGEAVNQSYAKQ